MLEKKKKKGAADRRSVLIINSCIKNSRLVYQTVGGYFCGLLSLPNVYPSPKQVKPKLTTAIKSIMLMA